MLWYKMLQYVWLTSDSNPLPAKCTLLCHDAKPGQPGHECQVRNILMGGSPRDLVGHFHGCLVRNCTILRNYRGPSADSKKRSVCNRCPVSSFEKRHRPFPFPFWSNWDDGTTAVTTAVVTAVLTDRCYRPLLLPSIFDPRSYQVLVHFWP